jgi:hypothetical protein
MKIVLVALLCLASSAVAHAQVGGIRSKLSTGSSGGSVSAGQVVKKYSDASVSTLEAHANLLDAVGLKEDAIASRAQAKNLTEGPLSSENMEATEKVVTEGTKKIQGKLNDKSLVLSGEAKKLFVDGQIYLATAAINYVDAAKDVKDYKPSTNPMSLNSDAKLAIAIGKKLPDDMSKLKAVIGLVVDYAKAKGIPLSPELQNATAALNF